MTLPSDERRVATIRVGFAISMRDVTMEGTGGFRRCQSISGAGGAFTFVRVSTVKGGERERDG